MVVGEVSFKSKVTRDPSQPESQMSFEKPRGFRFIPNRFKPDQHCAEAKTPKTLSFQSTLI